MYVCICNALKEGDITQACDSGCRKVSSVFQFLECLPNCGRCVNFVREQVDRHSAPFSQDPVVKTSQCL